MIARALRVAAFALALAAAPAQAQPAALYPDALLASRQPGYLRGLQGNLADVVWPRLTAAERAALAGLRLRLEPRLAPDEPFGFRAQGTEVILSVASLTFLDDLSAAAAWLTVHGYALATVTDYMMLLRRWTAADGPPPPPRSALCLPPDALDTPRVAARAQRMFDGLAMFVLLHEVGHVLHRHRPDVPPAQSREQEEAADRFALDILARLNEVPLGLAVLFPAMAHFQEVPAAAASDTAWRDMVGRHTHPLSPSRLRAAALHLAGSGHGFATDSRVEAQWVAGQILQSALLLAERDLQRLSWRIGTSLRPEHLGPRRPGQHLARHCRAPPATGLPFDGVFRGSMRMGTTDFDTDLVMTQAPDGTVRGSLSYGAGFVGVDGAATGPDLAVRWSLPPDSGATRARLTGNVLQGSWTDRAGNPGGSFRLTRVP